MASEIQQQLKLLERIAAALENIDGHLHGLLVEDAFELPVRVTNETDDAIPVDTGDT